MYVDASSVLPKSIHSMLPF